MSAPKIFGSCPGAIGMNGRGARGHHRPVKVIAVAGGKGGVGTTQICGNLAISLSMLGRKVMLLDADFGLASMDVILGLQPAWNLADLIRGDCGLQDLVMDGPAGVLVVPGASGVREMSALTPAHHVGIINAFSDLGLELDLLLIDNASGIGEGVLRFADAAHEVLLLVCDEPASIIGAYSLIKLLRAELGVSRFRVITNMTQPHSDGSGVFQKLFRLSDRFLDATLDHAGNVPFDDHVRRAAQLQTPLVTAFPSSPAAKALQALAGRVDDWAMPLLPRGNIEFFVERLLRPDCVRQGPALT